MHTLYSFNNKREIQRSPIGIIVMSNKYYYVGYMPQCNEKTVSQQ